MALVASERLNESTTFSWLVIADSHVCPPVESDCTMLAARSLAQIFDALASWASDWKLEIVEAISFCAPLSPLVDTVPPVEAHPASITARLADRPMRAV